MNYNKPCGCGCQPAPMMPEVCCNNVVKKCFVEEVPHVVNYNTHVVNECVKKHITVPKYTTTEETVYIDEYAFTPFQLPYQYQQFEMQQQMQQQIPNQNLTQMPNVNMTNPFNPFQF